MRVCECVRQIGFTARGGVGGVGGTYMMRFQLLFLTPWCLSSPTLNAVEMCLIPLSASDIWGGLWRHKAEFIII